MQSAIGNRNSAMFFDTHVHFDHLQGEELAAVIQRARDAGVGRILAVGSSADGNRHALEVSKAYPDMILSALGFDRDEAAAFTDNPGEISGFVRDLGSQIQKAAENTKVVALGEMGLDYHYSADTAEVQVHLFRAQLAMARELTLPVIVHSREADKDTLAELTRHAERWKGAPDRVGVLHCFTGGEAFAEPLLALGFHISFSGIVSFPKAEEIRDVAKTIPNDRLLVETDTPYLAPVPHRGKRNEPAYVRHVAEAVAQVKGCSLDELAEQTARNAEDLFTGATKTSS